MRNQFVVNPKEARVIVGVILAILLAGCSETAGVARAGFGPPTLQPLRPGVARSVEQEQPKHAEQDEIPLLAEVTERLQATFRGSVEGTRYETSCLRTTNERHEAHIRLLAQPLELLTYRPFDETSDMYRNLSAADWKLIDSVDGTLRNPAGQLSATQLERLVELLERYRMLMPRDLPPTFPGAL
jgi:hypothetical protein